MLAYIKGSKALSCGTTYSFFKKKKIIYVICTQISTRIACAQHSSLLIIQDGYVYLFSK